MQLKIDAEFPRFTQSMLETVYPHYLAPTPSMVVVQLRPDNKQSAIDQGYVMPRGTVLRSQVGKGELTPCRYLTAHEVTLRPIWIAEAAYHGRGLAALKLPKEAVGRAAVQLRLQCAAGRTFGDLGIDDVVLFLRGGEVAMRVYEQFFAQCTGLVVRPGTGSADRQEVLDRSHISPVGFSEEEALLPYPTRSFRGYRLLEEYFTLADRFMFVKLSGLATAAARCGSDTLDIYAVMRGTEPDLDNAIDSSTFALHCTPAVNLFPHRADRVHVSDRDSEIHVVPDRTRPRDYEVYLVTNVTGYGDGGERTFRPFYSSTDLDAERGESSAYYVVNRVPRPASAQAKQVGPRSSYAGSEVYLTLVDPMVAPYSEDLEQLAIETLCTNRDLPLQMPVGQGKTDFLLEVAAPVSQVACLSGPTPPRPSNAEGEFSWRLISHLSPNYLSLRGDDTGKSAARLRDLLRLYADLSDPGIRKQIDGLVDVSSRPAVRRVMAEGPIAFARGLEIALTFDESCFEGTGVFLLAAVLERFFARYVSINSFTETVLSTLKRGETMRWQPVVGQRHIL